MKQLHAIYAFLCLGTLFTAVSCTDTVTGEPCTGTRSIAFTPAAETRAAVDQTDDLQNFSVWGGYDGDATNVFDGVTVQAPSWTYSGGTQYWIEEKMYQFYAVHPATLPLGTKADVATNGTITVTGFDCSATGSGAVDLMTATATGNGSNPAPVALSFRHELAKVNVVATVEGGDATITNIIFAGMKTSGDYSSTGGWSNTEMGSFTNSTHQPLTTEEVDLLDDMLLIPQDVLGFTVTVDYSVGNVAQPQKVITLPTTISRWNKGKSYKYTLSFKRNTLTVTVKVVEWKEEDTSVSWQ